MSEPVPLGEICDFKYGRGLREDRRVKGTIPVFGSNGVVGWHNEAITKGPTIIIGRKGSIGEVHWSQTKCYPIDTTYFVDETKRPCELKWLYFALRDLDLTRFDKSAAVPGLNRDDAYEQLVVFPTMTEQQRILTLLEQAERLRRICDYTLRQVDHLVGSLLHSAFEKGSDR